MQLVSVGVGYIGLPLACLFAQAGVETIGITRKKEKAQQINQGIPPFHEEGLEQLLKEVLDKGTFQASINLEDEVSQADVILICVPTPLTEENTIDDSAVRSACERVGKSLKEGQIVVIESTISPGMTDGLIKSILDKESGLEGGTQYHLAHCPERAIPGKTLYEMQYNDRIIGGINEESTERVVELYRKMVQGKIITTDAKTAEIVKLTENASRDTQIAFANELALLCEHHSANVFDVIEMANCHPRVSILHPGIGVGGHCLPIDPWFLIEGFSNAHIIPSSRLVNKYMPKHISQLAIALVKQKQPIAKSQFVIFGLAYKPDVDDTRESPSETVADYLREAGATVIGFDPHVESCNFISTVDSAIEATKEADCIIIAQNHNAFHNLEWDKIRRVMRNPLIVDGVNFFKNGLDGFEYVGLGKP
jgi:UDP-N-acetyl-D-mannosaminuronic acid dehydrogenase